MALPDHNSGFDQGSGDRPLLVEPLLTAEDAAELRRIRRCTFYELARNRRLPHVRVGRRILFVRSGDRPLHVRRGRPRSASPRR